MALWQEMKEDARRHRIVPPKFSFAQVIFPQSSSKKRKKTAVGQDSALSLTTAASSFIRATPVRLKRPKVLKGACHRQSTFYGEQSNPKSASIAAMMADFAAALKSQFPGWTAWLLTSDRLLPRQMRLKESRKIVLFNGPLECRFFRFDMVAGSNRRKTGETLSQAQDG